MKEQIIAAINRTVDRPNEAAAKLFAEAKDLFTTCQRCRQQVRGTIAQLAAHGESCFADLVK